LPIQRLLIPLWFDKSRLTAATVKSTKWSLPGSRRKNDPSCILRYWHYILLCMKWIFQITFLRKEVCNEKYYSFASVQQAVWSVNRSWVVENNSSRSVDFSYLTKSETKAINSFMCYVVKMKQAPIQTMVRGPDWNAQSVRWEL
jgi:hypothetical protein